MYKMHYFCNNFQKSPTMGALRPQRCLTFNNVDLKFRDLAKLWFFKLIMTKLNFKKLVMTSFSDVITITSSKNVTKI